MPQVLLQSLENQSLSANPMLIFAPLLRLLASVELYGGCRI